MIVNKVRRKTDSIHSGQTRLLRAKIRAPQGGWGEIVALLETHVKALTLLGWLSLAFANMHVLT
jgi:hypothetical protein